MKVLEIEIYQNKTEFKNDEYDVYANLPNYETIEDHVVIGYKYAKILAYRLAKKYNVPIRENIEK